MRPRWRRAGRPVRPTLTSESRRIGGAARGAALGCPGPSHRREGGRPRSRLGRRSRRRGAVRFFYARPILFDPGGDRLVVAFDRAPRRTLPAPPQPLTQNGPRLRLAITDSGHRLDDVGYPRQGPHLGRKAVGPRALQQCLLHLRQLLVGQLRQPTGPASTGQSALALGEGESDASATRSAPKHPRVHHIDLTLAAGEHIRRSHPPVLQSLQVPPRTRPSAGTRPPPTSRPCHTPIVLPRNTNPAEQPTVLPKHL